MIVYVTIRETTLPNRTSRVTAAHIRDAAVGVADSRQGTLKHRRSDAPKFPFEACLQTQFVPQQ